jgi:hypothetical protein
MIRRAVRTNIAMDKRLPPKLVRPLRLYQAGPKESLRLLKAFFRIRDAAIRASLIDLIEAVAHAEQAKN